MQSSAHFPAWPSTAEPIPEDAPTLPRLPPPAAPDWIREAIRKYAWRVRDWTTQTWTLTHSPRRFMTEWAAGTREALNPLRFLAVGTTVTLLVDRAGRWFLHLAAQPHEGWRGWINRSVGQMVNVAIIGALMHVVLRRWSAAPFRSTLAAAVFAASGPGTLAVVVGWALSVGIRVWFGRVPMFDSKEASFPIPVLVAGTLALAWTLFTMSGVHRVRWWAPLLAMAGSLLALTLGAALVGVVVALIAVKLGY